MLKSDYLSSEIDTTQVKPCGVTMSESDSFRIKKRELKSPFNNDIKLRCFFKS